MVLQLQHKQLLKKYSILSSEGLDIERETFKTEENGNVEAKLLKKDEVVERKSNTEQRKETKQEMEPEHEVQEECFIVEGMGRE